MRTGLFSIVGLLALIAPAMAQEPQPPEQASAETSVSVCMLIESAAATNGLPLAFFARIIWQESRFRPDAVGPMTRSGERAQGIAQFMPRTAAERQLFDPFDPVKALPKSAEFLRELLGAFGNLGLAAAAYNAGPQRVRAWLAGRRGLPGQTRAYVRAVTGRSADDWAVAERGGAVLPDQTLHKPSCTDVMAVIRQEPNIFVAELERRVAEGAAAPWGVQLTAGFSRAKVLAAYGVLEKRFRAVLENRDLNIFKLVLRSRGTREFYQVRVGADTRESAQKLCTSLHAAGGACMVLRNPGNARAM